MKRNQSRPGFELVSPYPFPTMIIITPRANTPLNKYPGYDMKPSDGEALFLELWGMWSIPSLPLLPSSLWLGVVVPVHLIYRSNRTVQSFIRDYYWYEIELLMLNSNTWNYLTVYKQMNNYLKTMLPTNYPFKNHNTSVNKSWA